VRPSDSIWMSKQREVDEEMRVAKEMESGSGKVHVDYRRVI
jgi:hypothetical protein